MNRLLSIGPLIVFALATGCNNGLDHDSAVKVASSALDGTVAADVHVMTGNGGSVDVTIDNVAGTGSAHVTGAVSKTGDMITTNLDVVFSHWTDSAAKITLDGTLHETGAFSTPVPLSGNVQLTGALSASGAVTGSADFDLTGSYSPGGFSVAGQVGGQSIDVSLKVSL
jgi:hypothetical protein